MKQEALNRLAAINKQIELLDGEISHLFQERLLLNEQAARINNALDGQEDLAAVYMPFTPMMDQFITRMTDRLPPKALIACQGVWGAFSHQAAEKFFPAGEIRFFEQFEDVFQAVDAGMVDYGVLPIENTTAGSVVEVYDLMRRYDFFIVKETKVSISHCLLASKGTLWENIEKVYSHPQALNQCRDFFEKNSAFEAVPYSNTAAAAKFVAQSNTNRLAAVASRKCAEKYGLTVLAENIQDISHNTTRFICISKSPIFLQNSNKISLCLTLPHKAGSLCHLLNKFSAANLNLSKLESRPWPEKMFEFLFYLDIEGSLEDIKARVLLEELYHQLGYFKILGCYNEQ